MTAIGAPLGLLALLLVAVGIQLAGRPVRGTEGLISQEGMLVGVFQVLLGYTIAMATIFYALRTGEMVDTLHESAMVDRRRQLDAAIGNLIGSALSVASSAGGLAGLMKKSWRWYLPAAAASRERFALTFVSRSTAEMSNAVRWSEEIIYLRPALRDAADEVVSAAIALHDKALQGRLDDMEEDTRRLRRLTDGLRGLSLQDDLALTAGREAAAR